MNANERRIFFIRQCNAVYDKYGKDMAYALRMYPIIVSKMVDIAEFIYHYKDMTIQDMVASMSTNVDNMDDRFEGLTFGDFVLTKQQQVDLFKACTVYAAREPIRMLDGSYYADPTTKRYKEAQKKQLEREKAYKESKISYKIKKFIMRLFIKEWE